MGLKIIRSSSLEHKPEKANKIIEETTHKKQDLKNRMRSSSAKSKRELYLDKLEREQGFRSE